MLQIEPGWMATVEELLENCSVLAKTICWS